MAAIYWPLAVPCLVMRLIVVALAVLVSACASTVVRSEVVEVPAPVTQAANAEPTSTAAPGSPSPGGCADVVAVEVSGSGPYRFDVTVSSPDEGWEKYADQWRVEDVDGNVIGVRELTHPHVDEQPFTRSLGGVEAASGSSVIVAARDSVEGYCGLSVTAQLP